MTALLTALTYTKMHLWWRTGFGIARMGLILSIAGVELEPALRSWTNMPTNSTADMTLSSIGIISRAAALTWLIYFTVSIVVLNVHRFRDPAAAAAQSRRHLARTPWATQGDIDKLIAFWDEMHSRTRP